MISTFCDSGFIGFGFYSRIPIPIPWILFQGQIIYWLAHQAASTLSKFPGRLTPTHWFLLLLLPPDYTRLPGSVWLGSRSEQEVETKSW